MSSSKPAVWVTGYGSVSCAGATAADLWENAAAGRSGIVDGLGRLTGPSPTVAAELMEGLKLKYQPLAHHAPFLVTLSAIQQALEMARWDGLRPDDAIVFATTTGLIPIWEADMMRFCRGEIDAEHFSKTFRYEPLGTTLDAICAALKFKGKTQLVTTACSASTHGLALARLLLLQGKARRCLVGGAESLSRLTIEGFRSFQLLSSEIARPFDEKRAGINLSEGAAFLCLELEPGHSPRAKVSGGGFSSDAYHMTAPHPEGRGCLSAMQAALRSAGLTPQEVAWVHAHGTGSPHNDLAEGAAIAQLFGGKTPPVSSTKAIHGHALAASGALEAVLCVIALERNQILPTHNLEAADPKIRVTHAVRGEPLTGGHILKNTLGFGGSNAAIVLSAGGTR